MSAAKASAVATTRPPTGRAYLVSLIALLIPGGGHLWLGRWQKGVVFLVVLPLMFVLGLWLEGRLFPFEPSQPLVLLAALANGGMGLVYVAASLLGYGAGRVVAVTYEYGNAYLIVAGLLNALVSIDAFDIAMGRK